MIGWIAILLGVSLLGYLIYAFITSFSASERSNEQSREDVYKEKYSTDMNRFAARRETKVSTARTDLMNQLNAEATALAVKGGVEGQAELDKAKRETELRVNALAAAKGLDTATYLEIEKMTASSKIQLETEWKSVEQQLRGGFIFQLHGYQHLLLLSEYIQGLHEQSRQLEAAGKTRELDLVEKHIEFMEKDFSEKQRLLQAGYRQNTEGGDEDTDLRGNLKPPMEDTTLTRRR